MTDRVRFHLGGIVYFRLAPSEPGIVTGILFRPTGPLYYVVFENRSETLHYEIELTDEPSFDALGDEKESTKKL